MGFRSFLGNSFAVLSWLRTLTLVAVAGCGAPGTGVGAHLIPQDSFRKSVAPANTDVGVRETLSGVIKTKDWTLPKGATATVDKDLAVFATGTILLQGRLLITPGASVGLITNGPLTITGSVVTATDVTPNKTDPPFSLLSGSNVTIAGATHWPGSLAIATNNRGLVSITGPVTLGNGAAASSSVSPGTPAGAQIGGALFVGTSPAIAQINTLIGHYDPHLRGFSPASPNIVRITASVTGGRGGDGLSDVNGTASGSTQVLVAGSGASGATFDCTLGGSNLD